MEKASPVVLKFVALAVEDVVAEALTAAPPAPNIELNLEGCLSAAAAPTAVAAFTEPRATTDSC